MQKPFPERRSSVSCGTLPARKFRFLSGRRNKPSARSFSFRENVSRFKSNFSRRRVSARSFRSVLPFSNLSVLTVFFRGSLFRNAGFFSKSRKPSFPLKRKSFGCPLQKIRPFLNPQAVVPHVFFQPASELKGTSFKSESDWIVESKKNNYNRTFSEHCN